MTIPEGQTKMSVALHGFKASHIELKVVRDGLCWYTETYIFNTEAAKLYHVHQRDFIAESEAETDGHLGDVRPIYPHRPL